MDSVLGLDTNKPAGESETYVYLNYTVSSLMTCPGPLVLQAKRRIHRTKGRKGETAGSTTGTPNTPSRFASHHCWTMLDHAEAASSA